MINFPSGYPRMLPDDLKSCQVQYPLIRLYELNENELPFKFTEEELQYLNPKYHYDNSSHHKYYGNPKNTTDSYLEGVWKSISYPLVVIRGAYINIKLRNEETDILNVLRDQPWTLIYLTANLRRMKDYSVGVRKILDSFYRKPSVKDSGFPKLSLSPTKVEKRDDSNRGSNELSQQNRHILLFVKEILSIILQGNDQSEVYEGHKGSSVAGLGSAELMGLVEEGVKQLHAELVQEHSLLIRVIRNVHGKYAHNKGVYAEGLDACEQRKMLYVELYAEAWSTADYFRRREADEVSEIVLPVFVKLLPTLRADNLPTYWEGLSPAQTLRADILPTYVEGLSPAPANPLLLQTLLRQVTLHGQAHAASKLGSDRAASN